VRAAR